MVEFANTVGWWALLALIPFIILYLRKPKPMDRTIPSLMFLVKDQNKSNRSSFLQRFYVNFLFFLQLLALLLLALAIVDPFTELPYDVSLENTILIVDASASMQATEGGKTRFSEAIEQAKKRVSGKTSIILAEHIPLVILEDESGETATDILGTLSAKATTTNLEDAMLLAKDILGERPGRVVVLSDFNAIDESDLLVVKRTLSSEELIVEFVDVSNNAENAGITSVDVRKNSLKVYVKNFNTVKKTVNLKLVKEGSTLVESGGFEILPGSVETFLFDDTPTAVSSIILEPSDDFTVDNEVFISAPLKKKTNVLLITNKRNTHIENALLANPSVSVNVVNPPVLTLNTYGNRIEPYTHDVIIVHEINNVGERDGILPGMFTDISNFAKDGGSVIVTAQKDINEFKLADTAVVNMRQLISETKRICIDVVNEITKQFENEHCFATTASYFDATPRKGTNVIASIDGIPLMTYAELSKGNLFYYGIIDGESDFKTLPGYPIFWNSLISFMAEVEDINDFNVKTGSSATLPEQKVITPTTTLQTTKILFDEVGIYELGNKKIASNLLDNMESDVTKESVLKTDSESIEVLKEHANKKKISLSPLILIVIFILLLIELWYIKRRGDI